MRFCTCLMKQTGLCQWSNKVGWAFRLLTKSAPHSCLREDLAFRKVRRLVGILRSARKSYWFGLVAAHTS